MKRLLCAALLAIALSANALAIESWMGHHVLVAYYSQTGNTQLLAERIALLTGGDLYQIEPSTPYPDNKTAFVAQARKECAEMKCIELKDIDKLRINEYDIVFIGSPVWCGTWAAPAASFAMDKRLAGKMVVPFMSCGAEADDACHIISKFATESRIAEGIVVPEKKSEDFKNDYVKSWLTELFGMKSEGDLTQMNVWCAIARMKQRYPKITLCDVYKSFYQDFFGPGHIIESRAKAQGYIKSELKQTIAENVGYEKCGALGRYVRVDLWYVKSGKIPMKTYVSNLMQSVQTTADTAEWVRQWEFVMNVIEASGMKIDNMEADSKLIDSRWAVGNYAMHHSRVFDELYKPHYRIIKKEYCR